MTNQHQDLASGRWQRMSLCEQMANIGSEVSRALNWKKKNQDEMSKKASARALELLDLSISSVRPYSRLHELTRLRETLVDYFYETNQHASTEALWRKYFDHFNFAVRKLT
jgi:hypothetical protein